MSKRETVFRALAEGPAFSEDIADATGLPVRNVSAMLHLLWLHGRIERSDERVPRNGKTSAYLYARRTKPHKAWTAREVQTLKAMAGTATPREAARTLHRTVTSVTNQARRVGVKLKTRVTQAWPVGVRMQAVALRAAGKTCDQVAAELGVPVGTVKQWSRKMFPGLSSPARETRTTPDLPYHPPSEDNA